MSLACPRCGCVDLHSSRSRGVLEAMLRTFGVAPRRCAACGWRGLRPRFLAKARRTSSPELPATQAAPTQEQLREQHRRDEKERHRRHRRHARPRSKKARATQIVAMALLLGLGIGFSIGNCG